MPEKLILVYYRTHPHACIRVYATILCKKKTLALHSTSTPPHFPISEKLFLISIIITIIIHAVVHVAINITPIVLLQTFLLPRFTNSRTARQVIYDLELPGERLRLRSLVW